MNIVDKIGNNNDNIDCSFDENSDNNSEWLSNSNYFELFYFSELFRILNYFDFSAMLASKHVQSVT